MRDVKYIMKGMNCLTEMYSVIQADVMIETDPSTKKNVNLMRDLLSCRTVCTV